MPIAPTDFRECLRHFASGVTVVTIKAGQEIHGLTVSAFTSISPEPPLIAVVIDQRHTAYQILEREEAVFAVNILRQDQADLSDCFAWKKEGDRFSQGEWSTAVTGAPVLTDAAAWLDCTVHSRSPAGTHTIYVGEIQASRVPSEGTPPLVYWNRSYRRLGQEEEPDLAG